MDLTGLMGDRLLMKLKTGESCSEIKQFSQNEQVLKQISNP